MPVNMVEDTSLDLALSEEENQEWETLVAGIHDMGSPFMWTNPCGVGSSDCIASTGCGAC